MSVHPVYYLINYALLALNILLAIFCFGIRKRGSTLSMALSVLGLALFNLVIYFIPATAKLFERVPVSLFWYALLYYYNNGSFFSKLFIYTGLLFFNIYLYVTASFAVEWWFGFESRAYFIHLPILTISLFVLVGFLTWKYGKTLCDKLFTYTRPLVWGFYMILPVSSLGVLGYVYESQGVIWHPLPLQNTPSYLMLPSFMLASYIFIITAILNTHEKANQQHEAEFMRGIIATGRDHYEKMNVLHETLRILRHDYKYHIATLNRLVDANDWAGVKSYCAEMEAQIAQTDLKHFCENSVINALLSNYAERFDKLDIAFQVKYAARIDTDHFPNYDLCIVLGNLLQNALDACQAVDTQRSIDLMVKSQGSMLIIKVKNRYNGTVIEQNGLPVSQKNDGGYGLRSIRAIAERYSGKVGVEWDQDFFTVTVFLCA